VLSLFCVGTEFATSRYLHQHATDFRKQEMEDHYSDWPVSAIRRANQERNGRPALLLPNASGLIGPLAEMSCNWTD
jgi:hypothetical protein